MAKKKQEDPPKGSPAWMATFSDLMNLLLCFFVLLFSMSTVQEEKFQEVIASIQSSFSVLPTGGSSIGEGKMISSGISQLEMFDDYFQSVHNGDDEKFDNRGNADNSGGDVLDNSKSPVEVIDSSQGDQESATDITNPSEGKEISTAEAEEVLTEAGIEESEKIAEQVENKLAELGISDQVEVDFNANYVQLTLNGALLFNSGEVVLRDEALLVIDKLSLILQSYKDNIIEIEGHSDNVPIHSSKYESNDVLSMYRALYVADYIRNSTNLNPAHIKSAGRGEYVPIADNSTSEGRARNRRVEIKIFNSLYSNGIDEETN